MTRTLQNIEKLKWKFTINVRGVIMDDGQKYELEQNNRKFNIKIPKIKMSLPSPKEGTKHHLFNCLLTYNNHTDIFSIRFESINCKFCNETKQYVNSNSTHLAQRDGEIIWYSHTHDNKNNQYITNADKTYCLYNIVDDNWTLYIELIS